MNNRYGVTLRFNSEEKRGLQEICKWWKMDEKRILKFAFAQLYDSTKKLAEKIEAEEKEKEQCESSTGSSERLSPDVSADSQTSPTA